MRCPSSFVFTRDLHFQALSFFSELPGGRRATFRILWILLDCFEYSVASLDPLENGCKARGHEGRRIDALLGLQNIYAVVGVRW